MRPDTRAALSAPDRSTFGKFSFVLSLRFVTKWIRKGIWSLLKRSMANFAAADLDGLVRIVKRKLKKIQYRPHLIDGCLTGTGLIIEPW